MSLSQPDPIPTQGVSESRPVSHAPAWYRPTISPEHGVYVMLVVAFLTGATAAQQWTWATTLAFLCALAGFQAEYPLVLQIKQRRSWKPRLLLWAGLYGGLSLGLAAYLYLQAPVLLGLYGGAIAILLIDAMSVFYRRQTSITNELITFAGVCLAAPFACMATTGSGSLALLGIWLLNTLFFGSAIFTVKLRKPRTASWPAALIYHGVATGIVIGLWWIGGLPSIALSGVVISQGMAWGVGVLKFGLIGVWRDWYRTTAIQNVALVETISALVFLMLMVVSGGLID